MPSDDDSRRTELILRNNQVPGDILMLTAALRDLHRAHPGKYLTDVRTSSPDLWRHNPWVTPLREDDPEVERLPCHHPLIHRSHAEPVTTKAQASCGGGSLSRPDRIDPRFLPTSRMWCGPPGRFSTAARAQKACEGRRGAEDRWRLRSPARRRHIRVPLAFKWARSGSGMSRLLGVHGLRSGYQDVRHSSGPTCYSANNPLDDSAETCQIRPALPAPPWP